MLKTSKDCWSTFSTWETKLYSMDIKKKSTICFISSTLTVTTQKIENSRKKSKIACSSIKIFYCWKESVVLSVEIQLHDKLHYRWKGIKENKYLNQNPLVITTALFSGTVGTWLCIVHRLIILKLKVMRFLLSPFHLRNIFVLQRWLSFKTDILKKALTQRSQLPSLSLNLQISSYKAKTENWGDSKNRTNLKQRIIRFGRKKQETLQISLIRNKS